MHRVECIRARVDLVTCRRGWRWRLAICWGALIASAATVTASQVPDASRHIGRPVTAVHVLIEGRPVDDEAVLDLVETRVGEPLAMRQVRESILHLFSLGRFEDVRVDGLATADGIDLRYALSPVHPVGRVDIVGDAGLSASALRSALTERYGRTLRPDRLDEMRATVEDALRARGFMSASVTARALVDHTNEETVLEFDVRAATRARIGDVRIEGRPDVSPETLRRQLGFERDAPYDPVAIERRLQAYLAGIRSRGFYTARVDQAAVVAPDGRVVDLDVAVTPGPRVTIQFEGDLPPSRQREEASAIRREGSIDEDLIEDTARRLAATLRAEGYWQATTEFRRIEVDDRLDLIFDVRRGDLYRLATVEISGNESVPGTDLDPLVDLEPGEPFVQARLDETVAAIATYYRRLGFSETTVEGTVVEGEHASPVGAVTRVLVARITIAEGVRTLVGSVRFDGNTAAADDTLLDEVGVRSGSPFYQPDVVVSRDLVLLHYLNHGYQTATVEARAEFRSGRELADVVFEIVEGPEIRVDHVLVVGNRRISSDTIRRELLLASGQPLALDDLIESQRRLRALGVFRSVQITEVGVSLSNSRDILVTVDEAAATSIGYGGGLEVGRRLRRRETGAEEVLEFAPRGFFEIGRRNLWGKNRSIDVFTRASVRRSDDPTGAVNPGGLDFNEYRVVATYREPRPFGWKAEFLASAFLEQAIRSSFNFNRRGVNAELVRQFGPTIRGSARYSFDRTRLYDEQFNRADELLIDRLFPRVRLSSVSTAVVRDTRTDPLDPLGGNLISVDTEFAGRRMGSQVGFAKTLMQSFVYRQLPRAGRTVVAFGARLGLAVGLPRSVTIEDENGDPVLDAGGQPTTEVVDDLPASARFFAGGDSTVRGFAIDRLGTAETVTADGFPRGGNALLILNTEIRVPVWRELGAVAFVDLGNIFARVSRIDLRDLRGSVGFGIRYRSPVGPIRVDLGFKLNRRQFDNGLYEPRTALHVSIGQAF